MVIAQSVKVCFNYSIKVHLFVSVHRDVRSVPKRKLCGTGTGWKLPLKFHIEEAVRQDMWHVKRTELYDLTLFVFLLP